MNTLKMTDADSAMSVTNPPTLNHEINFKFVANMKEEQPHDINIHTPYNSNFIIYEFLSFLPMLFYN
jgi:hypothetical protein